MGVWACFIGVKKQQAKACVSLDPAPSAGHPVMPTRTKDVIRLNSFDGELWIQKNTYAAVLNSLGNVL